MANLNEFKRLIAEDFDKDDQALVRRLAGVLNIALEEIYNAMRGNLNFDNLNMKTKDVEVTVNSSGTPKTTTSFKSELKTSCKGLICIKAENLKNVNTYPTGQPFVSFTEESGQIVLKNITGLQADQKYRLRLISIG